LSNTFLTNSDFCEVKCSNLIDGSDIDVNKRDEHSMGVHNFFLSCVLLMVELREDEKRPFLFEAVVPVEQLSM